MEKLKELIKLKQNEVKINIPDYELEKPSKKKMPKKIEAETNSSFGNKSTMDSMSFKDKISEIKHLLNNGEYEEFIDLSKEINPDYKDTFADDHDVETKIIDLNKLKEQQRIMQRYSKRDYKYNENSKKKEKKALEEEYDRFNDFKTEQKPIYKENIYNEKIENSGKMMKSKK